MYRLQVLTGYDVTRPIPFDEVLYIRERLESVAQQIANINPRISSHLIELKMALFMEPVYQQFFINQVVYGQILETVAFVRDQMFDADQSNCENLCHLLHPSIQRVSGKLYKDGNYAEAACNAFIEIDSRLQGIYHEKHPNSEKELIVGEVQEKTAKLNDLRVNLIIASMICFYVSIFGIVVSFIIGIAQIVRA